MVNRFNGAPLAVVTFCDTTVSVGTLVVWLIFLLFIGALKVTLVVGMRLRETGGAVVVDGRQTTWHRNGKKSFNESFVK